MAFNRKLLCRVTPGEVSRDQAVIDYFYDDPDTPIDTIMSIGFFDKAGDLFYYGDNRKTYQRINIRAARGVPFDPPDVPARFQAVVSDVRIISAPDKARAYKVTVGFGRDTTWQINATPLPFNTLRWHSYFVKYEGLVRFRSNGTAPSPSVALIPSKYKYEDSDFCMATLLSSVTSSYIPEAGDAILGAYTEPSPVPGYEWQIRFTQVTPTSAKDLRAYVKVMGSVCEFI